MFKLEIEGYISDIIFRNEENFYTVAVMVAEDEEITIVGNLPYVRIDETIKVLGEFVFHRDYGEQFQVESVEIVAPNTLVGIKNYLSSGVFPGIGKKRAEMIIEKFGLDTLKIMEEDIERLTEIPGIGKKNLKKIKEAFLEQREFQNVLVFLQGLGISSNLSMKIYREYGSNVVKVIEENPYRLSEDIDGVGFKRADEIALSMGLERDSLFRKIGGLHYTLEMSVVDGNIYLPKTTLLEKASKILELPKEDLKTALDEMVLRTEVYMSTYDGEEIVYNQRLFKSESFVARRIVELLKGEVETFDVDLEEELQKIEKEDNFYFGKRQKEAIEMSLKSKFMVLTGGPGTGKTTTINSIIKIFKKMGKTVTLAAPTGRAAKRMTEASGEKAQTIHRLFEYSRAEQGFLQFGVDEDNPLQTDLLIIDESSMIDIILMENVLRGLEQETRVILVGDVDQLPSVGAGNVLKDLIECGKIDLVELDEIFRQAKESMIIVNAHRINSGEMPYLNVEGKDFFFIEENEGSRVRKLVTDLVSVRLPNFYGFDSFKDIQVLTPQRRGDAGVNSLNKSLKEFLNPASKEKKEKEYGTSVFRLGDKVMQTKNNYELDWKLSFEGHVFEEGQGIFNGDIGIIERIADDYMEILFDNEKTVKYPFENLSELDFSYATTVHKSQGSEFPVVVMPITFGPDMLYTRNLLYTAITRASKLVVLVGNKASLYRMVKNNRISKRYSTLDRRIVELGEIVGV